MEYLLQSFHLSDDQKKELLARYDSGEISTSELFQVAADLHHAAVQKKVSQRKRR